jgi:adenine-specific DNA-methyltransferase
MNYIGSKYKLSSFIKNTIRETVGNLDDKIFCDLFAGTGAIGRIFKQSVKKVISNDFEYYSYVLNKNYIGNHIAIEYENLIQKLNQLNGIEGFIFKNYSKGGGERNYFSEYNAKKIDAIRTKIEEWKNENQINENEYFFLLASLLESADKVANTASVYGAYLKAIKKTATQNLVIMPARFDTNSQESEVYCENVNTLIRKIEGNILYLDPPYNARQYGSNYHLLNTIAIYDNFIPIGKTGLRPNYQKSQYCKKNEVKSAFETLIKDAKFQYIFCSYNNEGLMTTNDIQNIMSKYGKYTLVETNYQRFMADKPNNRNFKNTRTSEHIHILEKNTQNI